MNIKYSVIINEKEHYIDKLFINEYDWRKYCPLFQYPDMISLMYMWL